MITKDTNDSVLLPDRHPQQELFVCDIADAILKDDMASMEHPFFSLSKKPDTNIRKYEHNGNKLEVIPSVKGLATIYDKDVLIYAISQLIAAKNNGLPISQTITMSARDLLVFTNRYTGGKDYAALEDALTRLTGTMIKTNVKTGSIEQMNVFGLVESAHLHRDELTDRVTELRIKLSDWVYNAIDSHDVLTLHRNYFRLKSSLERRIYELARKHCGIQLRFKISLTLLHKKSGATSPLKQFRYRVKKIIQTNHLPDYDIALDDEDFIIVTNRKVADEQEKAVKQTGHIRISLDTYNDARQVAPNWDIYHLEQLWRSWMADGGAEPPRNPDKAFIGFCRKYYERNGDPK